MSSLDAGATLLIEPNLTRAMSSGMRIAPKCPFRQKAPVLVANENFGRLPGMAILLGALDRSAHRL
jgi:hypothetical protein